MSKSLPRRVKIKEVVSSRYKGERPILWDERNEGCDKVLTTDGEEIVLYSNGGQATPFAGWEILLTSEVDTDNSSAYLWTLFGIAPGSSTGDTY